MIHKNLLTTLLILFAFAPGICQQITISGTVTTQKQPLPGVNVIVKGSTAGVSTDFDGNYAIDVASGDAILVYSYVGFVTQEIPVGQKRVITVDLEEDAASLEEVVVVGFGTQKREDLTGAINTLSSEDVTRTPVVSLDQSLSGQTPGVYIANRGGDAAAPINVRIRGVGTTGNSQPLFVVDGIPLVQTSNQTVNSSSATESNPLSTLNPNDIESITVLKDASAGAIYGNRAANGVILITTKRGKRGGATEFTYEAYTTVAQRRKFYDVLNTDQYVDILQQVNYPNFDFEEFRGTRTYDWQDAITKTGITKNHNIGISGGGEKSNFRISAGLLDQSGITIGQDFRRYSFSANSDIRVGKIFKFGESVTIGFTDRLVPSEPGGNTTLRAALNQPFAPIFDPDGFLGYAVMNPDNVGDLADGQNEPIQILGINDRRLNETIVKTRRVLGNIYGEAELLPGLTYRITAGIDYSVGNSTFFQNTYNFGNNDANKIGVSLLVKARPIELTTNLANTLTYNKTFGKNDLTLLLGHEETMYQFDNLRSQGNNLINTNVRLVDAAATSTTGTEADQWATRGFLGRVNYSYDSRYLMTVNVRRDETSRFSKANRVDYFPSFALGWNIAKESFMKDVGFSQLKLRASYGEVGNQFTGQNFAYINKLSFIPKYVLGTGQEVISAPTSIVFANPDLKWERSLQTNFGIDATLLDDKLNFTIEYYTKLTKDILVQVPLPAVSGFTFPTDVNLGEVSNKGIEISLGYADKVGEFDYYVNANFSTLKNKVETLGDNALLGNAVGLTTSRTIAGEPIGQFFGYKTNGLYQTAAELEGAPRDDVAFDSENRAAGDVRFVDVNGDGVIDQADRTGIGSPIPTFYYGLTLGGTYSKFDFSIFLQGIGGNDVYNYTKQVLEDVSSLTNKSTAVLGYWNGPGTSNDIPRIDLDNANNNSRFSDRWIESGAYTRIKNIQIGYTFDSDWLKRNTNDIISNFRLYAAAQNVAVFTKYSGLDPEVTRAQSFQKGENNLATGVDGGYATPQPITIQLGTRISF